MKILNDDYFTQYTPKGKPLYLTSWLYSQLQICGITFFMTNEANFNIDSPACDLPFTLAHELAHTKGVLREDDANLVALYVCLNSNNSYVRYSAYLNSLNAMLSLLKATNIEEDYNNFLNSISNNIYKDIDYSNNYWKNHDLFGSISKFFNDIYLKISANQTTQAYTDKPDTCETKKGDKIIYTINAYSPYQALLIYHYLNK